MTALSRLLGLDDERWTSPLLVPEEDDWTSPLLREQPPPGWRRLGPPAVTPWSWALPYGSWHGQVPIPGRPRWLDWWYEESVPLPQPAPTPSPELWLLPWPPRPASGLGPEHGAIPAGGHVPTAVSRPMFGLRGHGATAPDGLPEEMHIALLNNVAATTGGHTPAAGPDEAYPWYRTPSDPPSDVRTSWPYHDSSTASPAAPAAPQKGTASGGASDSAPWIETLDPHAWFTPPTPLPGAESPAQTDPFAKFGLAGRGQTADAIGQQVRKEANELAAIMAGVDPSVLHNLLQQGHPVEKIVEIAGGDMARYHNYRHKGVVDAWRHAEWNRRMAQASGGGLARNASTVYEGKNVWEYLTDGHPPTLYDLIKESYMDLQNNWYGSTQGDKPIRITDPNLVWFDTEGRRSGPYIRSRYRSTSDK